MCSSCVSGEREEVFKFRGRSPAVTRNSHALRNGRAALNLVPRRGPRSRTVLSPGPSLREAAKA